MNMSPRGTKLVSISPSPPEQTVLVLCALKTSIPLLFKDAKGRCSLPKYQLPSSEPIRLVVFFPVWGFLYVHSNSRLGDIHSFPVRQGIPRQVPLIVPSAP